MTTAVESEREEVVDGGVVETGRKRLEDVGVSLT